MGEKPTLLVDNECAFCSKTMEFIVKHGGDDKFNFLSIYSDESKKILSENGFPSNYDKSVVLFENGQVYIKSGAVLRVTKKLKGAFPLLYWLKIIPGKIRDSVYDFISRHRHKIYK